MSSVLTYPDDKAEESDICLYQKSFWKGYMMKMEAICEELHRHPKEVKDMTEDEQFAICYASGVDIMCKMDKGGNLRIQTTYPCGIVRDKYNHYTVMTKQPSKYSSEE